MVFLWESSNFGLPDLKSRRKLGCGMCTNDDVDVQVGVKKACFLVSGDCYNLFKLLKGKY